MAELKKILSVALAALLAALALTGCASQPEGVRLVFCGSFISDEVVELYSGELSRKLETPLLCSGFSFGTEQTDATVFGASAMVMTTMMMTGEVDLVVCDLENAQRYARGGMFCDLTELFTEEELAPYAERLLSFEMVDEEGNPTGERTPVCGIDVSEIPSLAMVMAGDPCGIFLVGGRDLEGAKEVFLTILNS